MKKKLAISLFMAISVAIVSLAADLSGGKPQADRVTNEELRTQIVELRARLQALEGQTKQMESTVQELKQSRVPTPLNFDMPKLLPNSKSPSGPSPKIWGEREVNGWTYYVVPCEEQSR
jgi:hypothetical protein